jgi:UDP-N-acetylglucosamine--N-acetylmuramyl-(pentapeptide) pyrophosphoryl-undecaprenol N-acetylglucosamine transferase
MLDKTVDRIFVTYEGIESRFRRPEKVVYTGTPLRSEFTEAANGASNKNTNEKPLVVSFWGSTGAVGMNNKIIDFIVRNSKEQRFNHIHATGVGGGANTVSNLSLMKEKLEGSGVKKISAPLIDIREYIDNMPEVLKRANLVLTRAGASTIAELTTTGTPAILVPSPNVTENHQEENARQLQNAGGIVMISENECTGDILFDMVTEILADKKKLQEMESIQRSLSVPDSASRIIDIVTGCINDIKKEGV